MTSIDKIETSTLTLEIKGDILFMVVKDDADLDLDAIVESVKARKKIQNGKKMLALVDNRKTWQISKEANEYSVKKEVGELSIAMAILSGSTLPTRLIGNFFIKFNKLHCPTKMFSNEDKALAWLESFRD